MNEVEQYVEAAPSAIESYLTRFWRAWSAFLAVVAVALVAYGITLAPPNDFPSRVVITVPRGVSAAEVAAQLEDAHVIKNARLLRAILHLSGGSLRIQNGPYLFNSPESLPRVAYRLVVADFGLPPIRITFPEGETARDDAERVHDAFPSISVSDFISVAQPYEGYLFPDTYLFLPSADAEVIVKTMRENFEEKTATLADAIRRSGHTRADIVTMASLIEREARTMSNKRVVAGILWNRLKLGMPLQVDAVFGYIFSRNTYSPSYADLKVDSPYNTYTHKGLPPGPIGNPGLDSLDAAISPTQTDYLYYLTGTDNLMHYATTYAGHLANQRKYLK